MLSFRSRCLPLTAVLTLCAPFHAVRADSPDPHACSAIVDDHERLTCYDKSFKPPLAERAESGQSPKTNVFNREPAANPEKSLLDSRWELRPDSKLGAFHIRAYKPVYVLPFFNSSNVNFAPDTPSPGHHVDAPERVKQSEAKFQLSLKTKAWEGIFGDVGDLWLGYTQNSHWQVNTPQSSRPFRETDYEPEAMLAFGSDIDVLGWKARLFGIGVNHQSNGRSLPLSRSWNRVIGQVGLDNGDWSVVLRPWTRVHESFEKDDNPDILDYMGHGDVQIVRAWNGHEVAVMLRPSDKGGAVQIDYAFPIKEELKGHVQLFDGYGESLIDYNHRALYLGIGLSLLEWY